MTDDHPHRPARAFRFIRTTPSARASAIWSSSVLALLLATGCATVPPPEPVAEPPLVASPVSLPEAAVPAPAPAPAPTPAPEPAAAVSPGAEIVPLEMTLAPFQPRFRLDPDTDAEHADLWQRVRGGFAMPELADDYVRKWEQWYARDPAYVQRMTERGGRYLFHIVEEVQQRGLPTELALLPFIESAFNPQAMSRAAASGMWQFMPGTGKDYELRQNVFRDDRRDVLASTRAALDYLQRLNESFQDWQLALAAYNWGPGNVRRAIDRNRRAGLPTDYSSLRMPLETREYLPKLQAVKNIVLRPEGFGLTLPDLRNHPFFLGVRIDRDIDVALAARLAGLELEEFQQLNPQMNKPVILAAGTPQVLLPYDAANRFIRALGEHRGATASWTAWVAPRTLKPAEAAKLINMNEGQLREVNHIPPRMLVKAGSTLLVPRSAQHASDVDEHLADNALLALAPESRPMRSVKFKAGRHGDSVAAVAKRYRVSAAQVAAWNGVAPGAKFKAGQMIVVQLAAPATRVAAKAAPAKRGKARVARATPAARAAAATTKRTRVAMR